MAFAGKIREKPDMSRLPRHIAIIMDGNGRWAKRRGLPRSAGHAAGAETFRRTADYCRSLGIKYLTVYAFSTENWKRNEREVEAIMSLLRRYLEEALADMEKNRVRIRIFGDRAGFSQDVLKLISRTEEGSERFEGDQINLCINYGGRAEILHACKRIARLCAEGALSPGDIGEDTLSGCLYSSGVPDPDLVIRPGGEKRTSNFLLWQSAYSEFYFTDTLWPDFAAGEIDKAILEFQKRERRYGGV